jgi:hypothetical protein
VATTGLRSRRKSHSPVRAVCLQDALDRPLTSDYGVSGGTFRNKHKRMDARRRGLDAADLLAELEGYRCGRCQSRLMSASIRVATCSRKLE